MTEEMDIQHDSAVPNIYYKTQTPIVQRLDLKTQGTEKWILCNTPRDFSYLVQTTPRLRARFAVAYKFYLADEVYKSVFVGNKKSFGMVDSLESGQYYERMKFVPFSVRSSFAARWWSKNSQEFRSLNKNDPKRKNWIKESLLDCLELHYRCFDIKDSNPKLTKALSNIHRFDQTIVQEELETEPEDFRTKFLKD